MNYYTIDQAIQLFNDAKISRFFDLPQLADLCSRGLLTLAVPYSKSLGHIDREAHTHQQHQTIEDACTFKGYLTSDALSDLLTDYANTLSDTPIVRLSTATIYEAYQAYFGWGDNTHKPQPFNRGDLVALLSSEPSHDEPQPPTTHDRTDSDIFTVAPNMLRLAADEVHRCIDDMETEHAHGKNELSESKEEGYQATIGILLELLTKEQKGRPEPLFKSDSDLRGHIDDMYLDGQSDGTLKTRFILANKALKATKERPRRKGYKGKATPT